MSAEIDAARRYLDLKGTIELSNVDVAAVLRAGLDRLEQEAATSRPEFKPVIEPTTLKYMPRERAPVCLHALDQGLVAKLYAEGAPLYRAAMVLIMTPHIHDYLTQHDPQALLQLRAACGLTEAVVGTGAKHGPDCRCGRCR